MRSKNIPDRNTFLQLCLARQRGKIIAVVVFSFVINILMLTVPLYLLQIFNRVIPSQSIDTLIFLTIIVTIALLTLTILEALRRFVFSQVGSWLDSRLGGFIVSGSIVNSVKRCSPSSGQGLQDLSTIRRLLSGASLFPILDIPWTPIFLLVLYLLHPVIGFITLIGALILFLVALYNDLSTRELTSEADSSSRKSQRYAASVFRNSDVIEAMGMRSNVIGCWDKFHEINVALQARLSQKNNRIAALARFVRMMIQIAVIGVGGWLVLLNEFSAGGLIASVLLMRRAVAPMDRAISSWKLILSARSAVNSVNIRLNLAPELNPGVSLPLPSGYLSIKNVSYTYPGRSKKILRGVTLKIKPSEVVGLTGNTAEGKSTLARLIVGLARPDSGYVKFDGIDITRWKTEDLGPLIGYLPQDSELFAGSVEANIARMGIIDKDAVIEAARLAGVHDLIMQFPEAYETEIGEGGAYLSVGQRQRLALARAIFKSPKLLVLDEPDANLDGDGKAALTSAIHEMKKRGAIIIFISHQEKVLNNADRVIKMRRGKIAQPPSAETKTGLLKKAEGIAV